MEAKEAKEKLKAGATRINKRISLLPFRALVKKKIPQSARDKFPLLNRLIPLVNQIARSAAVLLVVLFITCSPKAAKSIPAYSDSPDIDGALGALESAAKNAVANLTEKVAGGSKQTEEKAAQSAIKGNTAQIVDADEGNYKVTLTKDGQGVVIKEYIGPRDLFDESGINKNSSMTYSIQVRIPTTIQGMPVREIGPFAFTDYDGYGFGSPGRTPRDHITGVVIPQGVTKIGHGAFTRCYRLPLINIPEGITHIGDEPEMGTTPNGAFEDSGLAGELILPQSLAYLDHNAFAGTAINSITIPPGMGGVITASPHNKNVGQGVFANTKNLRTIHFPANMTAISYEMFKESGLTTITIPEGITEIGEMAFQGCKSLTTVVLPSTITKIGDYAFSNCALTTVTIPDLVTSIDFYHSFEGNPNLSLASQAALRRVGYNSSF